MSTLLRTVAFVSVLFVPACNVATSSLPSSCEAIEVDPMRELVVTDPAVVGRREVAFDRVLGVVLGAHAPARASAWMDAWSRAPGEETLRAEVVDPWAAASNNGLDPSKAPFELIAISNRIDLAALGRAPELRFVYGLVAGGARRPLTVIVELHLPPRRTTAQWASAWHALGSLSGEAGRDALLSIVDDVLAEPLEGQVRTQDGRSAPSTLLEFDIHAGSPLVPSPLFNQPSRTVDTVSLTSFVTSQEDAVMADTAVLPASMLASSITAAPRTYTSSEVASNVATTFSDSTCSGCHTGETTLDGTFHISPLRRGVAALSPFLVADGGAAPNELARRAEVLRGFLCGS